MKKYTLSALIFLVCIVICPIISVAQCNQPETTVIFSLDGFRWDYPQKTSTPTLNMIAREGVKAVSLVPSFPSKTFPNHYTIATGLYPDHHSLINNSFFDREMNKSYAIVNKEARFNPDFYSGEPIWITAQNQGVKTASFYWVGSDVAIQGKHPDYWKMYDGSVPFMQRTDTIIKWLKMPETQRPRLIMAYYHEPDGIGHNYGPDDPRTLKLVTELDSITGILYDRIKALPNGNCINFIVLSDHGMGPISPERNVALKDHIPENWPVRMEGGNPNFNLYADGSYADSVYKALKPLKGISVYRPSEVPEHLNYGKNPRVGDLIVFADSAWSITINKPKNKFTGGTHGYDPQNTDMHAIFYACGPRFKKEYVHPSFQNIHIYPLLAHLMGIKPAKTDGDLLQVIDMLKPQP
jgi:predicted AlkP superfamily pyrophosphatase or phosphodiesterase